MKCFILVTLITLCLINAINTLEYKDYDEVGEVEDYYKEDPKKTLYDIREARELFKKFIQDYNKKYKDEADYRKHYENFVKNLEEINRLNEKGGDASFDINMFADLGEDESSKDGGFQ